MVPSRGAGGNHYPVRGTEYAKNTRHGDLTEANQSELSPWVRAPPSSRHGQGPFRAGSRQGRPRGAHGTLLVVGGSAPLGQPGCRPWRPLAAASEPRPLAWGEAVRAGARNRAVFLDLQGTLGGDGLGDVRDFTLYPSAIPAIRLINATGLLAIVVTNQSHIARGYFTLVEFDRRMGEIRRELAMGGAWLDGVYCCPHSAADACECRKPRPGLLHQAQVDHHLDLPGCYVVGETAAPGTSCSREWSDAPPCWCGPGSAQAR